jgi:hypothetical protein
MADEVAYVQVVKLDNGRYVWESRTEKHKVIETSKQFRTEAAAHQDGADSHPHTYDGTVHTDRNPHTGKVETTPTAVALGPQVRHAIVNDGEPEYGEQK